MSAAVKHGDPRANFDGFRRMTKGRLRLLVLSTHPVQYATPIFRLIANDPRIEIQVAYCSMQGAEPAIDPGFQVEVKWDVPLLDGYRWVHLRNRFGKPRLGSFFGLVNTEIWRLIRRGNFDGVLLYTGYIYATFWIAVAAAKLSGTAVLFGTDATSYEPRDHKRWKVLVKKALLPSVLRLADVVTMPSEASRRFAMGMGLPEARVIVTPFVVDNEWWGRQAEQVDRVATRKKWNIPENASVALFCAKLQSWKRPQDALRAFAAANVKNSYLVFAGDGALRESLEAEARSLGINERVRFLEFVNQSGLPEVYSASDVLVLPSEYEPFGVVVNEAMLCSCPAIVSDRVGAGLDLVKSGITGFVYPCGDVDALAKILFSVLGDFDKIEQLGRAAKLQMESWSERESVDAIFRAVERARND